MASTENMYYICANPDCFQTCVDNILCCGACKKFDRQVVYCNLKCQKAHWKHRKDAHSYNCFNDPNFIAKYTSVVNLAGRAVGSASGLAHTKMAHYDPYKSTIVFTPSPSSMLRAQVRFIRPLMTTPDAAVVVYARMDKECKNVYIVRLRNEHPDELKMASLFIGCRIRAFATRDLSAIGIMFLIIENVCRYCKRFAPLKIDGSVLPLRKQFEMEYEVDVEECKKAAETYVYWSLVKEWIDRGPFGEYAAASVSIPELSSRSIPELSSRLKSVLGM